MSSNPFKWWYALVAYIGYLIALMVNTGLSAVSADSLNKLGFNAGALFNVTQFIIAGILVMFLIRIVSGRSVSRHNYGIHKASIVQALLLGVVVGLAFLGVSELVEASSKTLKEAGQQVMDEFAIGNNLVNDILLVIGVGLFAPVVEEIIFRGGIFNPLLQSLSKYKQLPSWLPLLIAMSVSAFAFTSAHGGGGQDAQMGLLALLAVVTSLVMYWTGSLLAAVYVHAVNNVVVFILSIWKMPDITSGHLATLVVISILCLLLCLPLTFWFGKILPKQ